MYTRGHTSSSSLLPSLPLSLLLLFFYLHIILVAAWVVCVYCPSLFALISLAHWLYSLGGMSVHCVYSIGGMIGCTHTRINSLQSLRNVFLITNCHPMALHSPFIVFTYDLIHVLYISSCTRTYAITCILHVLVSCDEIY